MRAMVVPCVLAAALTVGCQAPSDSGAPGSKPAAATKPQPPAAEPTPEPVIVPEGTALPLRLETPLSTRTNTPGDSVLATLASDVRVGERIVLPAGTEVRGRVTAALRPGKVKGRAHLAFDFDRVVRKGRELPVELRAVDILGPESHKRDAGIIGGGAGAGALIGAIVGGKKGAAIGAGVGAGAGTGVVLSTRGKEVEVPAGSRISVKLTRDARFD